MPLEEITVSNVKAAVQKIVPYLKDTSSDAPDVIHYGGWGGLGASAALRAIAKHPPLSLLEKFGKIIHIDCSRWKSRRALQRTLVDELKLTEQVAPDFYRQDKEDDFSGVDQGSRAEISGIATVIARFLAKCRCLVIFHNGSDGMVDLHSCGIPQPQLFRTKVLWTFRGWLRLDTEILKKLDDSHLSLEALGTFPTNWNWNATLAEEAREVAVYIHNKLGLGVTPEMAAECCLYLLSLNYQGGNVIDYNWATHASSYWVCDGIVEGGHDNQAWELARALHQHIRLDDYSSNTVPYFAWDLDISTKHWIFVTNSYFEEVPPRTTSLFFAPKKWDPLVVSLPSDTLFHRADQLRVLKLCLCTFKFSSPPFHCCTNLRFLGLDRCMDEHQRGEEEKQTGARAVETFQRLWVLDVCYTDWELDFPLETEEPLATNIREVHINKGRIWRSNLPWRRLPNLRKLRVVDPTSSWETGRKDDEFMDMVELELLDLSGNSTMQALPNLSCAVGLKTLVLDGCVELKHIGPQGLPPSLESFCLDTGADKENNNARISRISLAGCARLTDFRLCGSLPKLEELDLSHTAVKMLDLREVVQVGNLQRILLLGCQKLCSFSWPATERRSIGATSRMHQLRLLCIEGGEVARKPSWSELTIQHEGDEQCHAFVAAADMRFLQSLKFPLETTRQLKMDLFLSSSTSKDLDGKSCYEKKGRPYNSTRWLAAGSPLPKSLAYHDLSTQVGKSQQQITTTTTQIDGSSSSAMRFQPLDVHVEIGEGISDITSVISAQGRDAISFVMNRVQSLHVHDSSFITSVVPEHFVVYPEDFRKLNRKGIMNSLQWCRVERCPKLNTVFATNYDTDSFSELETFQADHLLMARSIWSRPRRPRRLDTFTSFNRLRAIHLHFCPRLDYVLVLSSNYVLSKQLETLHIVYCGDLRQVFPMEEEFLKEIAASSRNDFSWPPQPPSWWKWTSRNGMLEFPKLKNLYLHDLPSLQLICEAKMFAPNLETIYLRGCWGLRRLPATDYSNRPLPVAVDCEKDFWDKLEWDGMELDHHPSLFQPRHSRYYRKSHLRGTVLR